MADTHLVNNHHRLYVAKLHWGLFSKVNGLKRIVVDGAL